MAVLKIVTEPEPILHMISEPVTKIDKELQGFMDDMLQTMYADKGGGLAAVQVGVLKRILVYDPSCYIDTDEEPQFMVNPEIIYFSDEKCSVEEGCLSIPGARFEIERADSLKVKYLDYHGQKQEKIAEGMIARVIQHEYDHLNGVTMLNYASKMRKDLILKRLRKQEVR